MSGSRQLLSAGAGERTIRAVPVFSKAPARLSQQFPCLQFQCRGPGGEPLWEGRSPPQASTPPWFGLQVWRASLNSLGLPTPGPLSMPEPQVQKRGGVGRSGPVLAQSDGCSPWRTPRADCSKATESWPGLLQSPTPTIFCLKKKKKEKERQKVGEAGGRGQNMGETQRWSVGEGSSKALPGCPGVG